MKKSSIFLLTIFLSSTIFFAVPATSAASYQVVELWSNPMFVNDVAVSTDGQYIVAVNNTAIAFFSRGSSTPLWWYYNNSDTERFLSVAMSADGNQVIVGNNSEEVNPPTGSIYYFDNCHGRSGLQAPDSYNWTSVHFIGMGIPNVERRTIDISANGEYVVVGGTGDALYYFRDCTSKSGAGKNWDWTINTGHDILAVDMTPDGRYVAFGGGFTGFVAFTGNADLLGSHNVNWSCDLSSWIMDIAISNDGYAVAAVGSPVTTLHYWADAKSLSGTQINTWNNTNPFFFSVDVDSSGDRVVAGTYPIPGTLHFWDGARSMSGMNISETWTRLDRLLVYDVGIVDSGEVIVATSGTLDGGLYQATQLADGNGYSTNFFTADGSLIANFTIDAPGWVVSVAGDGNTAAVGTGLRGVIIVPRTLYVYGITKNVPVGGEILTVDNLTFLAPYLIVATVIVAAGALLKRRVP